MLSCISYFSFFRLLSDVSKFLLNGYGKYSFSPLRYSSVVCYEIQSFDAREKYIQLFETYTSHEKYLIETA
jgi:hypothetical protein